MKNEKILFVGAGSAGIGVGNLFSNALENEGIKISEAHKQCWYFDDKGLLVKERTDLYSDQLPFAQDYPHIKNLVNVIEKIKPTILIGLSGVGGLFTESVLKKMSIINKNPVVFALSNPTSNAECTAEQAYNWTNGNCIFASGSPFQKVSVNGLTFDPGQCNNVYIFPGVGLGAIYANVKTLSDKMFLIAAKTIPEFLTVEDIKSGRIFPKLERIRDISVKIAKNIVISTLNVDIDSKKEKKIEDEIYTRMFKAEYVNYTN